MSEPVTCVVVNKDEPALAPSESFLHAHIDRLPGRVISLIGPPCARYRDKGQGAPLLSQGFAGRALRRLPRTLGIATVTSQDERSVAHYLRRTGAEVVLAEYGPTAISVIGAVRRAGIPLVTHFHGWDAYVLAANPANGTAYQKVFRHSAAIIAVSRHMQDHLRRLGAPADRVIWNPCGPDVDTIPCATPRANPPHYISVGRPAPKKGLMVLLIAFSKVLEHEPAARLELVGVSDEGLPADLARALGISEAVRFHGFKSHAEVLRLMASARCYVQPSVTAPCGDMEGTPVALLEAMAAGLPIVATRHGGIEDVLAMTTAGILVDEHDAAATADAMLEYGRNPDRANDDGAAGRGIVRDHWAMQLRLNRLWEIVQCVRRGDDIALSDMARSSVVYPGPAPATT